MAHSIEPIKAFPERPLPLASAEAIAAAEWLKTEFGAVLTWESRKEGRQQGDVPLRIYTIPSLNGAQVAIRMNKLQPAFYVRRFSVSGSDVCEEVAPDLRPTKIYTGSEAYEPPSSILAHAPYLRPGGGNVLVRFNPPRGTYRRLLEAALRPAARAPAADATAGGRSEATRIVRSATDEESFRRQHERNSETGRIGELAALDHERNRLAALSPPCPDPKRFAFRVSPDDVGAGYDIASTWPGHERYIEVKTTVDPGRNDFFLSENERRTLAALGPSAWIYRVVLLGDKPAPIREFQDPANIFAESMAPSEWRVRIL